VYALPVLNPMGGISHYAPSHIHSMEVPCWWGRGCVHWSVKGPVPGGVLRQVFAACMQTARVQTSGMVDEATAQFCPVGARVERQCGSARVCVHEPGVVGVAGSRAIRPRSSVRAVENVSPVPLQPCVFLSGGERAVVVGGENRLRKQE